MARFVKQRTQSDCAIAAVANATGSSYKEIKVLYGGSTRGGIHTTEIAWMLSKFGHWRHTRPRKPMVMADWIKRHRSGRYVLCMEIFLTGHAVAVVDGVVLGGYSEKWEITNYFTRSSDDFA